VLFWLILLSFFLNYFRFFFDLIWFCLLISCYVFKHFIEIACKPHHNKTGIIWNPTQIPSGYD
jgi:hypothetical protein